MVYWQTNTVKYNVDQEIMRNDKQIDIGFSPFCKYFLYSIKFKNIWSFSIQIQLVQK